MRKYLVFILFLTGFCCWSQTKKTYKIGMLVDVSTSETEVLLERLKNEVSAVVGEDAEIIFPMEYQLVHNYDVNIARKNYQSLLNSEVDIIIAFGSASNIVIQGQTSHAKPTILFGSVDSDMTTIDLENNTSGIENLTYLMGIQSFEQDLKTLKELTDFTHVGFAIESGIAAVLPLDKTVGDILKGSGANYTIIPFTNVEDIVSKIDNLDALYLAGGFFLLDEQIKALSEVLIEKGIPSFTGTGPRDVEIGLMATNNSDDNINQFFRRIALTIEAYVNGNPLSEQSVFIDFEQRLTANFNTMQKLGIPIRYSLIAQTDFVGKFENPLSQKTYSLLDILNENFERNLSLQSQQKDVELSQQDVKTAKSNYYPDITANASFTNIDESVAFAPLSPEFSTDGSIQLTQTVYSEAANANITVQRNLQKAQEANFSAAQLDAVLEASNLYFNALISKVNVKIQNQNLQLTKENLKLAKQNYEAGQSGKSDMLRFESQMAQNTQTMIEAVNQLDQAFISINQLLNNPIDFELDVVDAELGKGVFAEYNYNQLAEILDNPLLKDPFVAFLIDEAKNNSPELVSLDHNLKAVERNFRLNSFGRLIPTVALQGNYNQNFNQWGVGSTDLDPANNYNVGVNISLPIFNQFRNNINKQTAKIQQDQLEINIQNTELAIESNVSVGVLNLFNQISNIRLSEVSVNAAKDALELVQTSYSEGAVSIIQLIDAQNNYLQAQLAQASATYNFLLNAIQLERFMGYNFLLHTEEENNAFRQRFAEFLDANLD
ncbi:TolC family protein [Ulvibacterium sp.]|uniref:TolC family protein n=1 Tax=Ulvibacterium sp. TaxID=2665914 RepID=UPI003CC573A2